MIDGFAIGLSFSAIVMALIALVVSGWAIAEVIGYKRSTHQVQFVSAEDELKESADDKILNKELSEGEFKAMMGAFGNEREVNK